MNSKDRIMKYGILVCTGLAFGALLFLLGYICAEGLPLFSLISPKEFLLNTTWQPLDEPPSYGILYMILSSFYVSVLAIIIAVPLGIGCAIFTTFCLPPKPRQLLLSAIDMLAGVPSVIFGFMGLVLIVKFFEQHFSMATGECVLAGAIVLAIMILPFITTTCGESMVAAKEKYYSASANLGVNNWYAVRKIILPQTALSFFVSLILAFSRAMGETMAVMMVMGNSRMLPTFFGKGETIPALIALEMGSAEYNSPHFYALNAAAMVLLIMLLLCNLIFYSLKRSLGKEYSS